MNDRHVNCYCHMLFIWESPGFATKVSCCFISFSWRIPNPVPLKFCRFQCQCRSPPPPPPPSLPEGLPVNTTVPRRFGEIFCAAMSPTVHYQSDWFLKTQSMGRTGRIQHQQLIWSPQTTRQCSQPPLLKITWKGRADKPAHAHLSRFNIFKKYVDVCQYVILTQVSRWNRASKDIITNYVVLFTIKLWRNHYNLYWYNC